jgi:hypothetical protein
LQEGAAKKKLAKRNGVFVGAAHTRPLFEKRGAKTYTQSLCEHTYKSKFAQEPDKSKKPQNGYRFAAFFIF